MGVHLSGIVALVILTGYSRIWMIKASKSEKFYTTLTGKSQEQLLESGEYIRKTAFANETEMNTRAIQDGTVENRAAIFRRFLPVNSDPAKDPAMSISFFLFTPSNPKIGKLLLETKPDTFFSSAWGLNQPLKIIVHDYRGNCDRDIFAQRMINAYMSSKKAVNLLCVNWMALASAENYFESAENTNIVGKKLGDFIHFLKRSGYIRTYSAVHVIGFGLGAHAAGVTGIQIRAKNDLGDVIGRITGLDPSGPGFSNIPPANTLDPTDAKYVDVIHTNMGQVNQGYLGISGNIGHADFYPNGGSFQPSCGSSIVGDVISTCSHFESVNLYVKSIKGSKFQGCKCSDWISFLRDECGDCKKGPLMGEMASASRQLGAFYLRT